MSWLTLDALPQFSGSGRLAARVWTGPDSTADAEIHFRYEGRGERLVVRVDPQTAVARPGERTSARVRVTDEAGRSATAEVSVAVVDEAVTRLARQSGKRGPVFWLSAGERRSSFMPYQEPAKRVFVGPIPDPRPGALLNRTARAGWFEGARSLAEVGLERHYFGSLASTAYAPSAAQAGFGGAAFEIRRSFSPTATWQPAVMTDPRGEAQIDFASPSNLTAWVFDAYAVGESGGLFGRAGASTRTSLPFQARVQSPRFLVEGDEARVPVVLVNCGTVAVTPQARAECSGAVVLAPGQSAEQAAPEALANGESRLEWRLSAPRTGDGMLRVLALAGAAKAPGSPAQREILVRNLENGQRREQLSSGVVTVHWGETAGYTASMDNAVECTALTVLALEELAPANPLIAPALDWLVLNRRSARWHSTRDTAFALFALARAVERQGGEAAEADVQVHANGRGIGDFRLEGDSFLHGSTELKIPGETLRPGANTIEIRRRRGVAAVDATLQAALWVEGDKIAPAAHRAAIARRYDRQEVRPTLAGTSRVNPVPLEVHGRAVAGEAVMARIALEFDSALGYVKVEVPRPAGCEPASALSGWNARLVRLGGSPAERGAGRAVYREERDDRSVFFLDRIDAGKWEIAYLLRAVIKGDFRVLPATVEAMYVPEIRGNSDVRRMTVEGP